MTDRMLEIHRIFYTEFKKLRVKYPDKSLKELAAISNADPNYIKLTAEMVGLMKDLSDNELVEQVEEAVTIINSYQRN